MARAAPFSTMFCTMIALVACGSCAQASTIAMTCKNQLREYTIAFDDERQSVTWRAGAVQTDYQVHKVRKDQEGLRIWGVLRDNGPDFVATFSPVKQITYYYSNQSQQTDPCR